MTSRTTAGLRMVAGALACAAAVVPIAVVGQAPAENRAGGWTAPKTPWGEPDLEGRWPVTHLMGTPLQRDVALGAKASWTEEEMAARLKQAAGRGNAYREASPRAISSGAARRRYRPGTPQRRPR